LKQKLGISHADNQLAVLDCHVHEDLQECVERCTRLRDSYLRHLRHGMVERPPRAQWHGATECISNSIPLDLVDLLEHGRPSEYGFDGMLRRFISRLVYRVLQCGTLKMIKQFIDFTHEPPTWTALSHRWNELDYFLELT
jgi:hypothetical protein